MVAEASSSKEDAMSAAKKERVGRLTIRPQVKGDAETGKFFVDVPAGLNEDGKRKRLLFDNRKTARKFAKDLWSEFEQQRLLVGGREAKAAGPRFADVASEWTGQQETRVQAEKKRANSQATDLARLDALKRFFGEHRIDEIDSATVDRYCAKRLQAGVKKRTINSELSLFLQVLRFKGVPRPTGIEFYAKEQVRHKIPTRGEVLAIMDQLHGRRPILVWLCCEAGLRPDEAYHAIWSWFGRDQEGHPVVHVHGHTDWQTKTAYSEREVPISEELLAVIQDLPRTSSWVFPGRNDADSPVDNMRKALATACKRAGIKRDGKPHTFSLKMFRKAFGTALATSGVTRATIQDLVGHQRGSPMTEQYYIFPEREEVKAATRHARVKAGGSDLAKSGNNAVATEKTGDAEMANSLENKEKFGGAGGTRTRDL